MTTIIEPEPVALQRGLRLREGAEAPAPLQPRMTEVVQGAIGNCPIAAVMTAMAHARPAALNQILGASHPGEVFSKRRQDEIFRFWTRSYYDVIFPGRGQATRISRLLYYDNGTVAYAGMPAGVAGWPSYVEKAYAVWKSGGGRGGSGGTYNRLDNRMGLIDPPDLGTVIHDLLGAFDVLDLVGNQYIDARRNARPLRPDDIVRVANRAGRRPTVAPSVSNGAEQFNIVSNHGYAVLGTQRGQLRLRNPHGGPGAMRTISTGDFRQAFQGMWQAV